MAAAAPASAAQSDPIMLMCPGQTLTVNVASSTSDNARNFFAAARIQGGGAFVPYVLTFMGTDLDGNTLFSQTNIKPAAVPADAVTCTFSMPVRGLGTFTGVVTGVLHGR